MPVTLYPAHSAVPSIGQVTLEVASIWAKALNIDDVGPDEDFFDLGGHSMIAAGILGDVAQRFGCALALPDMIDANTPSLMARLIMERRSGAFERAA
ncbi:acyl carrier protein [Hoeflea sp. WL0058]|uniref:Acyl carrier protein n=1 Tax=Flavimaribacter sediminis TaxID=2865987 RepID=A0AAE2ZKH2_9HYPH|nr:acyl carrier protein [Flavimaribacter sediminis]MBW8637664.1 acyl carrier protein [Flavimaribacter sediminis]